MVRLTYRNLITQMVYQIIKNDNSGNDNIYNIIIIKILKTAFKYCSVLLFCFVTPLNVSSLYQENILSKFWKNI